LINLTPLIPLSLIRRGGIGYVREASPLFNSPLAFFSFEGEDSFFRGASPLPDFP